ncbi:MAG: hypothetical protein PHZ19_02495 [Candidatus Thermoplasmatota archaeon]|nr:hypothetical protein [Candidatus Thermoplasmatota archaeon]
MKDEFTVLLPEVQIGSYTVKPWSFGQFKRAYPVLLEMVPVFQTLEMTPENAGEVLAERGKEIICGILPLVSGLIAVTLDISEAEVDALPFDQAAALGLTILSQNVERLKNSLPLIMEQIKAVVRGAA